MRPEQDQVLEMLYRAYFHSLEVHAYRFLGNWQDAQVAAQESFHIACEKIDALMASEDREKWLRITVKRVCQNMLRTRQRQLKLFCSLDDLHENAVPSSEIEESLEDTFGDLISQNDLSLLQKIIIDGVSYADAAGELGINIWACRKRVQRTLDKLHKKHRENLGEKFP